MKMKKAGIITHYDVHNHGAILQLTGLIRVLSGLGFDAKALRFDKNYDFLGHKLKSRYEISIRSLGVYIKYLLSEGFGRTLYNVKKHRTLNNYKNNESLVGEYYSEAKDLDIVIIGSDEVFALHTGPTPVFFGHCLPSDKIVSYAGSFGPTTVDDIHNLHCTAFVGSGLQNMNNISVRDANSADVVEHLVGKRPPIVVDPVLLYGFSKEIVAIPRVSKPKYLLVYAYDNRMNNKEEVKAIKEYARSKGLKTLSAGFYHSWCDFNVEVDPIDLLAYFRDAQEVVTDTFHGAILSIITGARFTVKTRESNNLKLSNLLKEYFLDDRILSDWPKLGATMEKEIDNCRVSLELEKRRTRSLNILKEMLESYT